MDTLTIGIIGSVIGSLITIIFLKLFALSIKFARKEVLGFLQVEKDFFERIHKKSDMESLLTLLPLGFIYLFLCFAALFSSLLFLFLFFSPEPSTAKTTILFAALFFGLYGSIDSARFFSSLEAKRRLQSA